MKILFFIDSLRSGGKERRLVELIKGLSKIPDIEMEIVLTKKDIHYQEIYETGIKIHYTIRKKLKKDPRIFYKFYSIAKRSKPDVIHVWGNLVAVYAIPAKFLLKIPMINNQITNAPEKVGNSIIGHRLSFPFSNMIIANSLAGLKAYDAPEGKSTVIYNGFDFNRLSNLEDKTTIRQRFNINTNKVVGMVATFSNKKDYKSYLMAANNIVKFDKDVSFICVGSGDSQNYEALVDSESKNNILFLGKQDGVESIMNICDIGVLSTYTEGISNTLLEFCALGKPVVSTLGGGNVELIDHDETGFLVPQRSPKELEKAIVKLLSNDKLRTEFGIKGKQKVSKQFSISQMIEGFVKAYNQMIEKG